MADIFDYYDWRGDLPFSVSPENEVDNFILSMIGCPDFTDIIPCDENEISLVSAVNKYFEKNPYDGRPLGALSSVNILQSLLRLPATERFRDLTLSGFVNKIDGRDIEQFSALTIKLPNGKYFISFRGTDDTLIGWKENFMMSVMNSVPAQRDSLNYLNWASDTFRGDFIIGGHSKGGNLAVFSAVMAPESVQRRIVGVYNFDGPGFMPEFYETEGYRRIRDRIKVYIPSNSVVGTLLTHEVKPEYVVSPKIGAGSHNGFNWLVIRDRFTRSESLSRIGRAYKEAISEVLSQMDMDEREEFIDDFFAVLFSTGADSVSDITEQGLTKALILARNLNRNKPVHDFSVAVLEKMLFSIRKPGKSDKE